MAHTENLLYNKLGDDFDDHDGGYHEFVRVNAAGNSFEDVPINKHYDIRAYHATNLTVPWTTLDQTFWQNFRYAGMVLGDPRSIVNATLRRRTQDELSISTDLGGTDATYFTMGQMDDMTIQQIERLQTASGNEEWTTGGGIFLGAETIYRMANAYYVPLVQDLQSTVTSYYNDDILTDFQDQAYFIEMVLRDFPAQVAAARLDLANSYIDFTSADSFPEPLTLSGNEITDALRATNVQGDGRSNDSSVGIWPSSTNLVANGGAETNATGYTAVLGGETVARTTGQFKFGVASVSVTTVATANSGVNVATPSLTSGTTYTSSVWVKAPSAEPMSLWMTKGGGVTVGTPVTFAGNGVWQRIPVTFTANSTEVYNINLRHTTNTVITFYIDGVQTEALAYATPYIHTNGGSASRTFGRIQAPISYINPTEGYAAFRVRIGVNEAAQKNALLSISDAGAVDYLTMGDSPMQGGVYMESSVGGVVTTLVVPGVLSVDTTHTLIFAWKQNILSASVDGAPFVSVARTAVPAPNATMFDIGSFNGTANRFKGEILWAAIGKGQLSSPEAATINTFGNTDPDPSLFPEDANTSFVWFADTAFINDANSDYIRFNESVNSLTAGGDTYFRINRERLVNADLTDLKSIRYRLIARGGAMTFKTQAMRLLPSDHQFYPLEIDTKRAFLSRTVPRTGTPEIAGTMGDMYFKRTRVENSTNIIKFNSGTNPVGNDNILKLYYRTRNFGADRLEVHLFARSTQSRLRVYSKLAGVSTELFSTPTNTNTLTAGTDYYLVNEVQGNQIRSSIYLTYGLTLGALQYTTDWQTIPAGNSSLRGHNGFAFEPYNYDFSIDYVNVQEAEFGHFESTSFASYTPVIGASLFTSTSLAANMLGDSIFQSWGDATLTETASYMNVVRVGDSYQGGVRNSFPVPLGNTEQVFIRGEIYPVGPVRGTYRVAFVDRNDTVAYIKNIPNLLPDQWNTFEIPVETSIIPTAFYFHIQQQGYFADTFRLRNLAVDHNTISWEGTNNSGTNWQPFLDTVNEKWGALKFNVETGKELRVRATAHGDVAWIGGYELVPRYKI